MQDYSIFAVDDLLRQDGDFDGYDEKEEANDPASPIWWESEIHYSPYGIDPNMPDWNEVTGD